MLLKMDGLQKMKLKFWRRVFNKTKQRYGNQNFPASHLPARAHLAFCVTRASTRTTILQNHLHGMKPNQFATKVNSKILLSDLLGFGNRDVRNTDFTNEINQFTSSSLHDLACYGYGTLPIFRSCGTELKSQRDNISVAHSLTGSSEVP